VLYFLGVVVFSESIVKVVEMVDAFVIRVGPITVEYKWNWTACSSCASTVAEWDACKVGTGSFRLGCVYPTSDLITIDITLHEVVILTRSLALGHL
jgi:hypothetical protein